MCLIIIGDSINDVHEHVSFVDAWRANEDGAGVCYLKNGRIYMRKGIMRLKDLIHSVNRVPKQCPVAIHLRLATHGGVSRENTHPFSVKDNYLMHNGVISSLGKSGKHGESDSAHLARILAKLPERDRLPLLESVSGKFAYITPSGIYPIGRFEDRGKVLLSNVNHEPTKYRHFSKDIKGLPRFYGYDDESTYSTITINKPDDEVEETETGVSSMDAGDKEQVLLNGMTINRETGEIIFKKE